MNNADYLRERVLIEGSYNEGFINERTRRSLVMIAWYALMAQRQAMKRYGFSSKNLTESREIH